MYNIIICDDDRAFVDYIKGVMAKSGMDKERFCLASIIQVKSLCRESGTERGAIC